MLIIAMGVLLLVCVKPMVARSVNLTVSCPAWQVIVISILDSFINVEEVDYFIVHNLSLLTLPKVWGEDSNCVLSCQWELYLAGSGPTLSLLLVCL